MNVTVLIGNKAVAVGQVEVCQEPGSDELAAAAVAWKAIARNGVFSVNGRRFTAAECAEWWA